MDVVRAFALARAAVERLPESVGRALFSAAGTAMGLSGSAGARRLRANQARIRPGLGPVRARLLSAAAMRSYMRYYYECFRLPVLGEDRILARVQLDNDAELRADLASGRSATAALVHAGNWAPGRASTSRPSTRSRSGSSRPGCTRTSSASGPAWG